MSKRKSRRANPRVGLARSGWDAIYDLGADFIREQLKRPSSVLRRTIMVDLKYRPVLRADGRVCLVNTQTLGPDIVICRRPLFSLCGEDVYIVRGAEGQSTTCLGCLAFV